jgi:hypothetical protein
MLYKFLSCHDPINVYNLQKMIIRLSFYVWKSNKRYQEQ